MARRHHTHSSRVRDLGCYDRSCVTRPHSVTVATSRPSPISDDHRSALHDDDDTASPVYDHDTREHDINIDHRPHVNVRLYDDGSPLDVRRYDDAVTYHQLTGVDKYVALEHVITAILEYDTITAGRYVQRDQPTEPVQLDLRRLRDDVIDAFAQEWDSPWETELTTRACSALRDALVKFNASDSAVDSVKSNSE